MRSTIFRTLAGAAALAFLTACGGSGDNAAEPAPTTTTTIAPIERVVDEPPTTTSEAPSVEEEAVPESPPVEFDRDGLLTAAIIVGVDGDLDAAIADGLVSDAEADAVLDALANGSLGELIGD